MPGINLNQPIKQIRKMTKKELKEQGWEHTMSNVTVLILKDGTQIFPSQDEEGNGPGELFGTLPDGKNVFVTP